MFTLLNILNGTSFGDNFKSHPHQLPVYSYRWRVHHEVNYLQPRKSSLTELQTKTINTVDTQTKPGLLNRLEMCSPTFQVFSFALYISLFLFVLIIFYNHIPVFTSDSSWIWLLPVTLTPPGRIVFCNILVWFFFMQQKAQFTRKIKFKHEVVCNLGALA